MKIGDRIIYECIDVREPRDDELFAGDEDRIGRACGEWSNIRPILCRVDPPVLDGAAIADGLYGVRIRRGSESYGDMADWVIGYVGGKRVLSCDTCGKPFFQPPPRDTCACAGDRTESVAALDAAGKENQ